MTAELAETVTYIKWKKDWRPGRTYGRADLVRDGGVLYLADDTAPVGIEPAAAPDVWDAWTTTGSTLTPATFVTPGVLRQTTYTLTDYADVPSAVAAIAATPATLVVAQSATVASSVTIPATVSLRFANGATLTPTGSAVLTIAGPIETGPRQIFGPPAGLMHYWGAWSGTQAYAVGDYVLSSGVYYQCVVAHTNQPLTNTTYWQIIPMVVITGKMNALIYPEWFGAVSGTVSTAQTAINLTALHLARDVARTIGGGEIIINGTVIVSGMVDFSFTGPSAIGFSMRGVGGLSNATIRYNPTAPIYTLFTLQGSNSFICRDLVFDGGLNSTNYAAAIAAHTPVPAAAYGVVCSRDPVTLAASGKHQFFGCSFLNCVISGHLNYASEDNVYVKPQFTRAPIGAIFTAYPPDETQDTNGIYNITKPGWQPCTNYNAQHASSTGGTDQTEVVATTGAPAGGTFVLSRVNYTTTPLPYNASAAQVQAALAALPCVRGTTANPNVLVTGADGGPWTVTWTNSLGHRSWQVMTTISNLTGGTSPTVSSVITTPGVGGKGAWVDSTNMFVLDGAFGSPFSPIGSTRCGLMVQGAQLFLSDGVIQAYPSGAEAGVIMDGVARIMSLTDITWDGGNVPPVGLIVGGYAPVDTTNPNKLSVRGGQWSVAAGASAAFLNAWDMVGSVFTAVNGSAATIGTAVNLNGWCTGNRFDNFLVDGVGSIASVTESGPSNNGNVTAGKPGTTWLAGTPQRLPKVTALLSGGSVVGFTIDDAGVGNVAVPTVVITDQNGSTTNATATATLSGSGIGALTITSAGTGITSATVTFTGGRTPALALSSAGFSGDLAVFGKLSPTTLATSGAAVIGASSPGALSWFQSTHTWADDDSIHRAGEFDAAKSAAGSSGLYGIDSYAILSAGSGTQSGVVIGLAGRAQLSGAAAASAMRGVYGVLSSTGGGAIAVGAAIYADAPTLSNGGTIGTAVAFYNAGQAVSGVTTPYGLYSLGGENRLRSGGDAIKTLVIQRNSSSIIGANLTEWQNESGAVLASVSPTGAFTAATIDATKLTGAVPAASLALTTLGDLLTGGASGTPTRLGVAGPSASAPTQVLGYDAGGGILWRTATVAHASTHARGGSDTVVLPWGDDCTTRSSTMPWYAVGANFVMTTGTAWFQAFTCDRANYTATKFRVGVQTAAVGATLQRLVLYTLSGTTLTAVAKTADAGTPLGTVGIATTALVNIADSTSNYAMVYGQRYVIGAIQVGGSTIAKLVGNANQVSFGSLTGSFDIGALAGQTDLSLTTQATGSLSPSAPAFWAAVEA